MAYQRWGLLNSAGIRLMVATVLLAGIRPVVAEEERVLVQDFETAFEVARWPPDQPGEIAFAADWRSDGERSLRIDGGLMAALVELQRRDWRGFSLLRFRVHNPGKQTVPVGFELQDQYTQYHERHQNAFGVLPGTQVIEMDLTGGLWRGEENRPYRGQVKTPIDLGQITRLSFYNHGDEAIYIDQVELVRVPPLETAGSFAFDFGRAGAPVMPQMVGVRHTEGYTVEKGYGLLGEGQALERSTSYPTPLLGDGVVLPEEGFQVDLPGGDYLGWVAFERGGF